MGHLYHKGDSCQEENVVAKLRACSVRRGRTAANRLDGLGPRALLGISEDYADRDEKRWRSISYSEDLALEE